MNTSNRDFSPLTWLAAPVRWADVKSTRNYTYGTEWPSRPDPDPQRRLTWDKRIDIDVDNGSSVAEWACVDTPRHHFGYPPSRRLPVRSPITPRYLETGTPN